MEFFSWERPRESRGSKARQRDGNKREPRSSHGKEVETSSFCSSFSARRVIVRGEELKTQNSTKINFVSELEVGIGRVQTAFQGFIRVATGFGS